MLDLLIRGGTVVTPGGAGQWEVGVQGERIVAVAAPGVLPQEAERIIDATGKVVIPGGIEPHAHIALPIPAAPDMTSSGPTEVSAAALFGGTTTIVDFAYQSPQGDLLQAIEARNRLWEGKSYADYSYHCLPTSALSARDMEQVGEIVAAGFPSFKIFTTSVRPPTGPHTNMVDFGRLATLMERVTAHGGIMVIHAEDDDMVQYNYRMAPELGRQEWHNMHLIHTNLSEDMSFRRVIRLAERQGAGLYMVHVSAKEGVDAITEARRRGLPVYGETLHSYATFTFENYRQPDGMKYHTYPSLKGQEDTQRLWDGLLHGDLSTIATDHVSTSYAVKVMGKTVVDTTGGHNGIETRVGIMYTEGVVKRAMSLERFVALTATNPAKLLGFYPRKGVIAPGSDADVVIIDPSVRKRLSMTDLHLEDYSIWEGWPVEGWPVLTVLRGRVVVEDGKMLGQAGYGKLVRRQVDASVLARPLC
ncbi:MAG: amidohydrolase family protein [Dehalococcoidia bacterium]